MTIVNPTIRGDQMSETMFNPGVYDLAGTPKLDGRKASSIVVSFDGFELDHTDALHMALAGKLQPQQTIRLVVYAVPKKLNWNDDGDRVGVTYRMTIEDIAAEPRGVDIETLAIVDEHPAG